MKIIDAHHHFWDPIANYHPWLRDEPMIPFRYGDYSSIRKPFMPDDYDAATKNWDVVATVTMEGEWDENDPTGEALWMQALSDETKRPAAHVAQAWLDRVGKSYDGTCRLSMGLYHLCISHLSLSANQRTVICTKGHC